MLSNCTVTLRSVTTDRDDLGDETYVTTETVLEWALIGGRSSTERVDQRSPAVVTAAVLYGPFGTPIDADDIFIVSNHSPSMNGEWQVEGRSSDWSLGSTEFGFEVAVKRAEAVAGGDQANPPL